MYYSPLEQFEPIPYFFPFKLGFFYIFGTNVTYILILLLGIFFFINGSFWSIISSNNTNKNLYSSVLNMDNSGKSILFFKIISLPFNYITFFYKNMIFPFFFKSSNSLFNTVPSKISILLINYKKNLFRSLTNYSISGNYNTMYNYIYSTKLNSNGSFSMLSYNFCSIKIAQNCSTKNYFLYFLRVFFFFTFFFKKLISNLYNIIIFQIYDFVLNTVVTSFSSSDLKKSLKYFPFFLSMFFFILLINTIGIIPYSSTVSSYLSVTLILTLIIIIGAYFTVFKLHGIKFFNLFMPQGCPFILIFFIIPIEFISYVFRLVSLSARLFANMMAGHSLLAVLAGFSWVMFNSSNSLILLVGTLPLFIVFLLFFLETGVAIVQAVVFTILSCMYMDEAVNLTH
jgi:ATP synthase subunit 6